MSGSINIDSIPKDGPYSHGVVSGNFVFLSGQTGQVQNEVLNFDQQFGNSIEKIRKVLEAAGCTLENVVKISVYLAYRGDLHRMNDLFGRYFPNNPPARTTLVTGFTSDGVLVEIDATATK
jgi:2-iminobutanoate/2-iminopropanoate deaminase